MCMSVTYLKTIAMCMSVTYSKTIQTDGQDVSFVLSILAVSLCFWLDVSSCFALTIYASTC
jgi:hypothetical protein